MLLLAATGRRVVPALVQTPWAAAAAAAAPGRGLAAKAKADKNKPKDKQRVGGGKQQAGGKKAAGDQGGKAAKAKAALQLLDVPLQARNLPDLTREVWVVEPCV